MVDLLIVIMVLFFLKDMNGIIYNWMYYYGRVFVMGFMLYVKVWSMFEQGNY